MTLEKEKKQLIFSILFPILVLFFIQVTYKYSCYFLIASIFMVFFIAYSFFQKRMREKNCFKNCYFKEDTFIAKIIISPYFTMIFYLFVSLIYTISIIYAVVSFEWYFYIFLGFFIAFVFVLDFGYCYLPDAFVYFFHFVLQVFFVCPGQYAAD